MSREINYYCKGNYYRRERKVERSAEEVDIEPRCSFIVDLCASVMLLISDIVLFRQSPCFHFRKGILCRLHEAMINCRLFTFFCWLVRVSLLITSGGGGVHKVFWEMVEGSLWQFYDK